MIEPQPSLIPKPDLAYRIAAILLLASVFYCISGWLLSWLGFLNSYLLMIVYHGITDILLPLFQALFDLTHILFFDDIVTLVVLGTAALVAIYAARKSGVSHSRIKAALLFMIACPVLLVGVFGISGSPSPIESILVRSNSYNLAASESISDGTELILYECDWTRIFCNPLFSTWKSNGRGQLVYDTSTRIMTVLIDGDVVYSHPVE